MRRALLIGFLGCVAVGLGASIGGSEIYLKYDSLALSSWGNIYHLETLAGPKDVKSHFKVEATSPQVIDFDMTPDGAKIILPRLDYDGVGSVSFLKNESMQETVYRGFPSAGSARVTPDGKKAWVANANGRDVWVFDVGTEQLVATFEVPSFAFVTSSIREIKFSADGKLAYLGLYYPGAVVIIDTATFQMVTFRKMADYGPISIDVDPQGLCLYVYGSGTLSVLDPVNLSTLVARSFQSGGLMTLSPDGKSLYMCGPGGLTAIDTQLLVGGASNFIRAVSPLTCREDVAVTPDNLYLFVVADHDNMYILDATTLQIRESIPITDARRVIVKLLPGK